jgi:hypothetical protein
MLTLTPDKPEDLPTYPDEDFAVTRESAEELDLSGPLNIPDKGIVVLRVKTGRFTLNISVNTLRRTDRLVVTFMGARGGSAKDNVNARRPMFARRDWDVLFDAPILAISDPQTEIDWDSNVARAGFYLGTYQDDLVPEILALINKVCDEIGVSRDRVVLYGASSGGTSAMLVGSRRREGTGIIAACPFLRPDHYRDQVIEIGSKAAGGTLADWERMTEETPWRNSPLTAVRDGMTQGHDVRVVVAQNLKDKSTINRHFPGLWRRFDINPEGGVSPTGRVMAVLYTAPSAGHGHEPREFSGPLIRMAYEFFDKPLEISRKKAPRRPRETADEGADA